MCRNVHLIQNYAIRSLDTPSPLENKKEKCHAIILAGNKFWMMNVAVDRPCSDARFMNCKEKPLGYFFFLARFFFGMVRGSKVAWHTNHGVRCISRCSERLADEARI